MASAPRGETRLHKPTDSSKSWLLGRNHLDLLWKRSPSILARKLLIEGAGRVDLLQVLTLECFNSVKPVLEVVCF